MAKVIGETLHHLDKKLERSPSMQYAGTVLYRTLEENRPMWAEWEWHSGERELVCLHALDRYKELVEQEAQ